MKSLYSRLINSQKMFIGLLSLFTAVGHASITYDQQADTRIKALYHNINKAQVDMSTRIDLISASFLGKPYLLGALGEGPQAQFDQSPLYRADAFDCETFVTTTLAIALASNFDNFQHCILKIRYDDGKAEFIHRNHFTGLDWNLNNQRRGFVKDITTSIKNEQHQPVFKMAVAFINKPAWYQHFTVKNIKLIDQNPQQQQKQLAALQKQGSQLKSENETVAYLPLDVLFDTQGKPNHYLFKQIPNASIIEIIRPNWDLRSTIGTCLNVSHLGFVFIKNGKLIFRQASSELHQVVDVPLIDYLRHARTSPTIKGINVQVVVPEQPFSHDCR